MLKIESANKYYRNSEETIHVLKNINLDVKKGTFIAIMGPSGSGKSTLLGVAAGLDRVDDGKVLIDGEELGTKSENELAKLRSEKIGFIFQNFQLIRNLTALENVSLPMVISKKLSEKEIAERARFLLEKVSLGHRVDHFPAQLSGGEEQRVAIARAFANNPVLLFADEPTGNLDSKNSEIVLKMLIDLNKNFGSTLVIVTHDKKVADLADLVYEMKDGVLELKQTETVEKVEQEVKEVKEKIVSKKKTKPKTKSRAKKK